jgi:hypothetical protein
MEGSTFEPEFSEPSKLDFYELALGKELTEEEAKSLPYGPGSIKVDDIDEAISRIKQLYPNVEPLGPKYSLVPGETIMVIHDPNGHMLVLIEEQEPV